jgi:23S rRNA (adenine2503-C2)-methyltransferase
VARPAPGELTFVAPRGAKTPPRHLADLSPAERKEAVAAVGEKPFRARQLSQHYFVRYAHDPEQWTDIPAGSRAKLQEALLPELMTVVRHLSTDQGTTRKTLWRLFDGALVESVLMRYPGRVTRGVSSQAE